MATPRSKVTVSHEAKARSSQYRSIYEVGHARGCEIIP